MNWNWLFRLIAIAIPFVFFIVIEGALRLVGFGHNTSLFIENPPAPQYLLPRPDVVKRYFPPGAEIPNVTIETNFFTKKKPENGLRIFVQGGSTAAGFPFGFGASLAGMLDYRLKQTFPDRPIEVINTALSAVNSYTLLDFSDEIIEQQPDAILIYAGHNEFLGILGVGSSYSIANSHGTTLLFLKLKDIKIFQLIQYLYAKIGRSSTVGADENSRTTMSRIAKHKNISTESEMFHQGLEQFRRNLDMLLAKYHRLGIPVFIATIASNLSAQAPFVSSDIASPVGQKLAAAIDKLQSKHFDSISNVEIQALEALAKEESHAATYFGLGQLFSHRQEFGKARENFILARDHDLLRFRAPSQANQLIRSLAAAHGAYLVDANAALAGAAANSIIGSKLMLEHLHPTVEGYFIIADTFYQRIAASRIFGDFPKLISKQAAKREIPIFPAEEYWGRAKIADLIADYPFTSEPQKPKLPVRKTWSDHLGFQAYKQQVGWIQIALRSLEKYKNEPLNAALASKLLAEAVPNRADYNYSAGVNLISARRALEAPRYLLRAIALEPRTANYQLALIHAYLLQQRVEEAKPWVQSVLAFDPDNQMALKVAQKLNSDKPPGPDM